MSTMRFLCRFKGKETRRDTPLTGFDAGLNRADPIPNKRHSLHSRFRVYAIAV